jgi:hypothetical protein
VFIVPEEKSAYIKIDSKDTDKQPGGGDYSTDQEYCLRIEVTKDPATHAAAHRQRAAVLLRLQSDGSDSAVAGE